MNSDRLRVTRRIDRRVMRIKLEPESHVFGRSDHLGDELCNDINELGFILLEHSSDNAQDVSLVELLDDFPVLAQIFEADQGLVDLKLIVTPAHHVNQPIEALQLAIFLDEFLDDKVFLGNLSLLDSPLIDDSVTTRGYMVKVCQLNLSPVQLSRYLKQEGA